MDDKFENFSEEAIEGCEFKLYELNREIEKTKRILDTIDSLINSENNKVKKFIKQLKFSILTSEDEIDLKGFTYEEALKLYVLRLNKLEAREIELSKFYETLTTQSVSR